MVVASDVVFGVADGFSTVSISVFVLLLLFLLPGDLTEAVDWGSFAENDEVGASLGLFFPWAIALA